MFVTGRQKKMKKENDRLDRALGLGEAIGRRDFLNGAMLSTAAMWSANLSPMSLFARSGSVVSDGDRWSGNTEDVFAAGHAIRDGVYDDPGLTASDTGEVFDRVIVGGGFSGLGAAYYCRQAKGVGAKVLVLENHRMFGGNARRDEFTVAGKTLYAPQASIVAQDLPPAFALPPEVETLFERIGVRSDEIRIPSEASAFSVFWDDPAVDGKARWYANVMEAPLQEAEREELMAFFGTVMPFYQRPDWEAELVRLDKFSFKGYAESERKWTSLLKLMHPDLAVFFSLPEHVSAAAVYAQFGGGPRPLYCFPGGNSGFLRYLMKHLIPDSIPGGRSANEIIQNEANLAALDRDENPVRVRLGASVVRVEHEGSPKSSEVVRVTYLQGGKLYRVRARGVIMAGGGYITQHVVRDLPPEKHEAYRKFRYAPILQINLALHNSRALDKAGLNFISSYRDGFGVGLYLYEKMTSAGLDPGRDPERPNVIGMAVPMLYPGLSIEGQTTKGRMEMLETSFESYERRTREDLARLLGPSGFDPKRDIAGISISRWGHHGYTFPYPGIYSDGAVETSKKPHGRIAFAHTDLERFSHMMGAVAQGYRAVKDLEDRT